MFGFMKKDQKKETEIPVEISVEKKTDMTPRESKIKYKSTWSGSDNNEDIEITGYLHSMNFRNVNWSGTNRTILSTRFLEEFLPKVSEMLGIVDLKVTYHGLNFSPNLKDEPGKVEFKTAQSNGFNLSKADSGNVYIHLFTETDEIVIYCALLKKPINSVIWKKSDVPLGTKKYFSSTDTEMFETLTPKIIWTTEEIPEKTFDLLAQEIVDCTNYMPFVDNFKSNTYMGTLFKNPAGLIIDPQGMEARYNAKLPISYSNFTLSGKEFTVKQLCELVEAYMNIPESRGALYLTGEPGTGKTYFINHLCHFLSKTNQVIKINISDFLNFFQDSNTFRFFKNLSVKMAKGANFIFIIEDAEKLVVSNVEKRQEFQSVLLNYISGAEADALNCKFIMTLNCHKDDIDPAFTREGRMIFNQLVEFKKLDKEKAIKLARELDTSLTTDDATEKYESVFGKENATLAQVYEMFRVNSSFNLLKELTNSLEDSDITNSLSADLFEDLNADLKDALREGISKEDNS